jgi:hypothetical protein
MRRTRLYARTAAAVCLMLAGGPAWAGDLAADLTAARAAVAQGDPDAALDHLESAEEAAESLGQVANARMLARLWHLRGAALHKAGDDNYMDAWRVALVIDNEYPWDEKLVDDGTAWNLFEALRAEVRDRPDVDPGVPEATGAAKIFVDGERRRAGDMVKEGTHLGQIECPDATVHGTWTTFKRAPKWFKLCPDGVDTSVIVADDDGADDEWGDMGPAFGAEPGDGDADATATSEAAMGPQAPVEVVRKKVLWPAFAAGVGTAAAAGAFQAIALRQNANYNDINNPDYQTAADLEQLRKATNRNQTLVYPLLAVSGGLFFAATYQW